MNDYVTQLIQKYRQAGILLDSNIMLLYVVGSASPLMITNFKRTYDRGFTEADFLTLVDLLNHFEKTVTTPNILTEVSNLLGQLPEYLRYEYFAVFANGITVLDEQYLASSTIGATPEFISFGLTDAGVIQLARNSYLLITEDFRLSQYAQSLGVDTLNFNHIRPLS